MSLARRSNIWNSPEQIREIKSSSLAPHIVGYMFKQHIFMQGHWHLWLRTAELQVFGFVYIGRFFTSRHCNTAGASPPFNVSFLLKHCSTAGKSLSPLPFSETLRHRRYISSLFTLLLRHCDNAGKSLPPLPFFWDTATPQVHLFTIYLFAETLQQCR